MTDHDGSHIVIVAPSPIHGRGVFATRAIDVDTHIGTFVGVDVEHDGEHVLWIEHGDDWRLIEGTGPLRFLNHDPAPNAQFHDLELYSIAHIEAGQEITIHYGEEWDAPAQV